MKKDSVAVIIGIKNRYDYRIVNALKSIRNQDYDADLIEIILVDYGSEEKYKEYFDSLCQKFNIHGIWIGVDKVWNKSNCLNIGIKNSSSEYLLNSDVDIVFSRDYISSCIKIIKENERQALYCKMLDSHKDDITAEIHVSDVPILKEKCFYRDRGGGFKYGSSIIFLKKTYFEEINGYDEFYKMWGNEDGDFIFRLSKIGLDLNEISDITYHIHQWHPKFEGVGHVEGFDEVKEANSLYYRKNYSIIRNLNGCGQIENPAEQQIVEKRPQKLEGTIWGITTFFNPTQYTIKYENYKIFREKTKRQGLKLIAVELVFGNTPFELKNQDADIVIRLRTDKDNILWQKEAMLNCALKRLPRNCDKIVWIDCDVIFKNENWLTETCALLEQYVVVQPFEKVVRLKKGKTDISVFRKIPEGTGDGHMYQGIAYGMINSNGGIIESKWTGLTGFAWAARRSIFKDQTFYDRMILGGGDLLMANAFYGLNNFRKNADHPFGMVLLEDSWIYAMYQKVKGSVYYTNGNVLHLWHGNQKNKAYTARDSVLRLYDFEPREDVKIDDDGVLVWNTDKYDLRDAVRTYFWSRNEDGSFVRYVTSVAHHASGVQDKHKIEYTPRPALVPHQYPEKLPGTIWGITTFFNPAGYENKYENFKIFRQHIKRQGLKLLVVELSFEKNSFELKYTDADIVIRVQGDAKNIMWQKEALLNIGLDNLPKKCDKFVWLDGDIIFQDNEWVIETKRLLEKYRVVQPYSLSVMMKKGQKIERVKPEHLKYGDSLNTKRYGYAYTRTNLHDRTGHPGLAWAARRSVFKDIKLYDKMILGSADVVIADSMYSSHIGLYKEFYSHPMIADIKEWMVHSFEKIGGSVFYRKGTVLHLWHGNPRKRQYMERNLVLRKNDFNPKSDIIKNRAGIWQWKTKKDTIVAYVKSYFFLRNEENSFSPSYLRLYFQFLIGRIRQGRMRRVLNLKKDRLLGNTGYVIKKISPRMYRFLVKRKPGWAQPLNY